MRRARLERAVAIVQEEIARWHAFGWWPQDPTAPEFQGEARAVAGQIDRVRSETDAAHCLSRVFTSAFGPCPEFAPDACLRPGRALYARLVAEGLIAPS